MRRSESAIKHVPREAHSQTGHAHRSGASQGRNERTTILIGRAMRLVVPKKAGLTGGPTLVVEFSGIPYFRGNASSVGVRNGTTCAQVVGVTQRAYTSDDVVIHTAGRAGAGGFARSRFL